MASLRKHGHGSRGHPPAALSMVSESPVSASTAAVRKVRHGVWMRNKLYLYASLFEKQCTSSQQQQCSSVVVLFSFYIYSLLDITMTGSRWGNTLWLCGGFRLSLELRQAVDNKDAVWPMRSSRVNHRFCTNITCAVGSYY